MGILSRYHLKLKRPAPRDFDAVNENLRELERWANILPVPAPQLFEFTPGVLPYSALGDPLLQSFDFALAYPNTVLVVDLFPNITTTAPGGGEAECRAFIDGVDIDINIRTVMNEAAIHATPAVGYVTVIAKAGAHTLELHGHKTINAGTFDYHGNLRLWVL